MPFKPRWDMIPQVAARSLAAFRTRRHGRSAGQSRSGALRVAGILGFLAAASLVCRAEPLVLTVDFGKTLKPFRPLHGINKGPLVAGGLIDLTTAHRELGIPFTRLHDCHWPNPYVVDMHVVFPDPAADPDKPTSYNFTFTDEYLSAIRAAGSRIIYRLGESIEHTTVKRFVHPPRDYERWAAACLGIIRHYNEGWADGFQHDIRHWEIWNEPDNRPAMWSGTDEDYFRLYQVASRAIKGRHPHLKVGGPGVGNPGELRAGAFRPTAFVTNFLAFCRRESLPLDFFSWHCYTADPGELVARAVAVRKLLDDHGFPEAESHLNEWNYLPGNSWEPLSRASSPQAKEVFYDAMVGAPGAAFIATSLLRLQDAPVDVCNLFHGEIGPFGLFSENGVPRRNFYAMKAFQELSTLPTRCAVQGPMGDLAAGAGLDIRASRAAVLLGNPSGSRRAIRLEWQGLPFANGGCEVRLVDHARNLEVIPVEPHALTPNSVTLELAGHTVCLVTFRPAQQR